MAADREEVQVTDREYRAVFERSPEATLVLDAETRAILDANTAAVDLFGRSREALIEGTLSDLRPDGEDATALCRQAVETGSARAAWEIAQSGESRRVDVTLERASTDADRLFAYVRVEESDDHLATVIEHLPVVLFALDPDGTFTLSRGRGLESLGLEPGDLDGTSAFDAYADNPAIVEACERALDGESVRTTQDVAGRTFDTQYRPIVDADGVLERVIGVSLDVTEQKEREQQLETLIETIPAGVFMTRTDGEVEYVNERMLEIIDVDDEHASGSHMAEMLTAEQERQFERHNVEAIERGTAVDREHTFSTPEGDRTIEAIATPIADASGDPYAVVGVATDITERKQRERKLEENDAILTQMTETTDDVFWLFNEDFSELRFVNDAFEEVWGMPVEAIEADSMAFMDGVHPDDREIVLDAVGRLQAGESTDREYRVDPTEDFQRWVWVRGEPILDDDGNVERIAGFARDITDRKERERHLEQSQRQFEAVFNDPQSLVGLLDTDGTIRRVNEATLDHTVADQASIEGTPFPEMDWWSHDEELQADLWEWLAQAADGEYVEYEADHPLPDGTEMTAEGTIRPVTDDEGTVRSLIASARDITERKDRERQLKQSNERLEKFAYVASHDLQEPLRTVSNYIELIEAEYGEELDEEAERFIDVVVTGSERMQSMINGLLDYSRVTTRGNEFEPVDTEQVVDGVVSDLGVILEDNDGTVSWGALPTVEADGDQLRQVVQNLVKNALEHADSDSVDIEVRAMETPDEYRFEVADDGPGIEPNRQEKIFRIFKSGTQYQTSSQAKGIGLAICENIVQRHGGEIWVESEPGEGATFVFTIEKTND